MTKTEITVLISAIGEIDMPMIPLHEWNEMGRRLGTRFNADVTVYTRPAKPPRATDYIFDIATDGDARNEVLGLVDYIAGVLAPVLARYRDTNLPPDR
jgi:hypothetical protein